jgi:biopolymer transport protein TolR
MGMTSSGGHGPTADINVTALIDVLLVLLIIFMVIQPVAVRGLDALIPQPPKSDRPEPNPQTIVVQVLGNSEHGITYKINEASLSKTNIEPKLAAIFATRTNKVMFIKGDANLDFSVVADIINSGHQAGVDNIGIITPQAGRSQEP